MRIYVALLVLLFGMEVFGVPLEDPDLNKNEIKLSLIVGETNSSIPDYLEQFKNRTTEKYSTETVIVTTESTKVDHGKEDSLERINNFTTSNYDEGSGIDSTEIVTEVHDYKVDDVEPLKNYTTLNNHKDSEKNSTMIVTDDVEPTKNLTALIYNKGSGMDLMETVTVDRKDDDYLDEPNEDPNKWLNQTLKFLESVMDDNKILQNIYNATNEPNFDMMKHFLNMQEEFIPKLYFDKSLEAKFNTISDEIKIEMENLKNIGNILSKTEENFLTENILKNLGNKLLNLIFSQEFLKELSRAANEKLNDDMDLKTTPQRAVLDFIYGGFLIMIKEHAMYAAVAEELGAASPFSPKFVATYFRRFFSSIKIDKNLMLNKHNQLKHESYVNFNPLQNSKMIKFETYLQKLVNTEEELNGKSCDFQCDWITRKYYTYDGCKGELRDCNKMDVGMNDEVDVVFSENSTKIHDVVSPSAKVTTLRRSQPIWLFGYICDICECTCDQLTHPLTERFLYAGKIEAEEGHVVTGVRFAKKDRVIFLQLQVGRFNANGYINKSSLHWMEPPEDLTKNFFTLTYYNRVMDIKALDFGGNSFMTGFQLINVISEKLPWGCFTFKIFGESRENGTKTDVEKTEANQIKFIEFKASSLDYDFGQSTFPFFNGEDITFDPPMAVTGLGFRPIENKADGTKYIKPYLIHKV